MSDGERLRRRVVAGKNQIAAGGSIAPAVFFSRKSFHEISVDRTKLRTLQQTLDALPHSGAVVVVAGNVRAQIFSGYKPLEVVANPSRNNAGHALIMADTSMVDWQFSALVCVRLADIAQIEALPDF